MRRLGPLGVEYDDTSAGEIARVSHDTFAVCFTFAREGSSLIAEQTARFDWADPELQRADYFLTLDGRSGFAVTSSDRLVYVFSLERGRGDALVAKAVEAGATSLDCFDGRLVDLYRRYGFAEYRRVANHWVGEPDVVYMRRPVECVHCARQVVPDEHGGYVDLEATGDDSIWREVCDANHNDRVAAHEQA